MRTALLGAMLLAISGLARAQPAAPPPPRALSVAAYGDELRAAESALASGALGEAAARGEALRASRVEFAGETVAVDPALVQALAGARPETSKDALLRVRAVLRALPPSGAAAAPAPDAALLRRAQEAERRAALPEGGDVAGMPLRPSLPRRFIDSLSSLWSWFTDLLGRLWEWFRRLWPRSVPVVAAAPAMMSTRLVVIALVVAVGLLLGGLAVAALRRSGKSAAATSEPERASERDEDPLSREQDEWETYASELAAAGRLREAIRAWYHAVLVALFRAGLLHHHKGRTNWEYVARISPDIIWRPQLMQLTRRFDHEWYGRERSSPDALRECASDARSILTQVRQGRAA